MGQFHLMLRICVSHGFTDTFPWCFGVFPWCPVSRANHRCAKRHIKQKARDPAAWHSLERMVDEQSFPQKWWFTWWVYNGILGFNMNQPSMNNSQTWMMLLLFFGLNRVLALTRSHNYHIEICWRPARKPRLTCNVLFVLWRRGPPPPPEKQQHQQAQYGWISLGRDLGPTHEWYSVERFANMTRYEARCILGSGPSLHQPRQPWQKQWFFHDFIYNWMCFERAKPDLVILSCIGPILGGTSWNHRPMSYR